MFALLVASAGLALHHVRQMSATIAALRSADLERLWLTSNVNEEANDGARKLIVLLAAPRELRPQVYAEIDAAHRRLDSSMALLARLLERGDRHPGFSLMLDCLQRYRSAYRETAELIEADDHVAAKLSIIDRVDVELSMLISATQNLDETERDRLSERLSELDQMLARDRTVLLGLGSVGGLLALALTIWVYRGVAKPLRAVARAARQLSRGNYDQLLAESPPNEVGDIGQAFNQLARAVRQREAALRELIEIDPLTGLLQRDRFIEMQSAAVRETAAGQSRTVLVCFDIERLKSINSLLGFDAGDEAIKHVAKRAQALAAPAGTAARLGGGTFVAILPLKGHETAAERAKAYRAAMDQSLTWNGHAMDLAVTLGFAICSVHGETLPELIRRAEQALYEAKRTRAPIAAYSPSIEAARLDHLSLLSELQQAIERGELVPFLQPKLCLRSNTIASAEALVRWRHPTRGWIPPAEFIPFAESTGRIVDVTRCMLSQCAELLSRHLPSIQLAVNVSTYDLRDPSFVSMIQTLLSEHSLTPDRLRIEITESGLLDTGTEPIGRLAALRDLGVGVSIDDFGTGQSSLAYLRRLPANELKIDRSFVSGADRDAGRQEMLSAIVRMAHGMGLAVTAEGAETAAEVNLLREIGCDYAQGFAIGRPMSVTEFIATMGAQLTIETHDGND
ncbi:EAL domain-containing protein [Ideonella sp. DXS29W]|uniref:EAL domain-containing protein n=1 Tax=Ideonella lacteola TaxID=2984193 RepID=A0ABU9BY15_9BURK